MDDSPDEPHDPDEPAEAEGLGHVLRSTLSQAYDYVHLIIAGSLLWAVSLGAPTLATAFMRDPRLIVPAFYLLAALTVGPATVALYGLSEVMARRELPGLGALFGSFRRFYLRSAGLFLVQTFLFGGIGLAAWFYRAEFDHWLLEAVSVLWLYIGLFWLMVALYVPAFLVRDDGSIWLALKKGVFLTLAHPGYSFLVLLQVGCLCLLVGAPAFFRSNIALGVSFLVFFLFLPGFVPLLATNAMNDLLRKHERQAEAKEEAEEEEANRWDDVNSG